MAFQKTTCPVTREYFDQNAKAITVQIGDRTLSLTPREFSTLSLGWQQSDKIEITVGTERVKVQCNLVFTVIASKELPPRQ